MLPEPLKQDDRAIKSFDLVADTTKQLITLSTGIIAVSVTFGKDVFSTAPGWTKVTLAAGWLLFLISICLGVLTMQGISGCFDRAARGDFESDPSGKVVAISVYDDRVNPYSLYQNITFAIAVVVVGVAAAGEMMSAPTAPVPGVGTGTTQATK